MNHVIIASRATLARYLAKVGGVGPALGRAVESTGELELVRRAERREHNERVRRALTRTGPHR